MPVLTTPRAAAIVCALLPGLAHAAEPSFQFTAIEGGTIDLADFRGHPVLVVNTASLCGFTPQYDDLQALSDKYQSRGLVVLGVPSNDFNQELASGAEVKEFCELNFNLKIPLTEITHVIGPDAHPFYQWMAQSHNFTPGWNFNKILIGAEGQVLGTWGSAPKPTASAITSRIEAALP